MPPLPSCPPDYNCSMKVMWDQTQNSPQILIALFVAMAVIALAYTLIHLWRSRG